MSDLGKVVIVGFALCVLIGVTLFVLWAQAARRLDDHDGDLAVIKAALQLGGPEPLALTDAPTVPVDTEPMRRVDLVGGARTRVREAAEANQPRPTPFPRQQGSGRHRAGGSAVSQTGV